MEPSAWDLARDAAASAGVELRPAGSPEAGEEILAVIRATWGLADLMPSEMVVALGASGNVPYGAYDDLGMVGFVLGWAGVDAEDGWHAHSHMLATLPDRRHKGVGYALKLAQRAHCLGQGIHLLRWTFDPMLARNAWLNLGKLGATADRFRRAYYGAMSDDLNAGDRSDRLMVRWDLDRTPGPRPPGEGTPRTAVPRDYPGLRATDPARAAAERDRVAGEIEARLAEGLVIAAFDRGTATYGFADPGTLS
jgi:predicted GNAT superfamily acetyltransferase